MIPIGVSVDSDLEVEIPKVHVDGDTTPRLLSKFDSLTSEWTSTSDTPRLMNKLGVLQRQWSMGSQSSKKSRDKRDVLLSPRSDVSTDSTMGRSTLSSYETCLANVSKADARQPAFERLYRNEKPYIAPPRNPDDEVSALSVCSNLTGGSSLEKRLSYVPHGEVRRVRQQQRLEARAMASPVTTTADSVFERLYRNEPRTELLTTPGQKKFQSAPRSAMSSARAALDQSPRRQPAQSKSTATPRTPLRVPAATSAIKRNSKAGYSAQALASYSPESARKRRAETSFSAASVSSVATDSVYERLYRREPRPSVPKSTNMIGSSAQKRSNDLKLASPVLPAKVSVPKRPTTNDIRSPGLTSKATTGAKRNPRATMAGQTHKALFSASALPSDSSRRAEVCSPPELPSCKVDNSHTQLPRVQTKLATAACSTSPSGVESRLAMVETKVRPNTRRQRLAATQDSTSAHSTMKLEASSSPSVDRNHVSIETNARNPIELWHGDLVLSHDSAITIQRFWRMAFCARRFRLFISALLRLQFKWVSYVNGRIIRQNPLQLQSQSVSDDRGDRNLETGDFTGADMLDSDEPLVDDLEPVACAANVRNRQHQSVVSIQRLYRCHLRLKFLRSVAAASRIQSVFRRWKSRNPQSVGDCPHQELILSKAVVLQSAWRQFSARETFLRQISMIRTLQAIARGGIARSNAQVLVGSIQSDSLGAHRNRHSASTAQETDAIFWKGTVGLQAIIRGRAIRQKMQDAKVRAALNDAATKVQRCYALSKLNRRLATLESAGFLLHRSLYGSFSRSVCLYAILQMNSAVRYFEAGTLFQIIKNRTFSSQVCLRAWEECKLRALSLIAVVLQSFIRGCLCRKLLASQQIFVKKMFKMGPFVQRDVCFTPPVVRGSSSASCRDKDTQLEQHRLMKTIAHKSALSAESYVAHLLGAQREVFRGVVESPCLLRLTARTREAQRATDIIATLFPTKAKAGLASD
jgi:IQ calmodulin-binding motif